MSAVDCASLIQPTGVSRDDEVSRTMNDVHTSKIPIDDRCLMDLLDERADQFAERPCLTFEGETLKYAEVMERSKRVAQGLVASGFQTGMKGAVYSTNNLDGFIATLGIIRAGGTWMPINPRNSLRDNAEFLKKFGCDAIFFHSQFSDALPELQSAAGPFRVSICIDQVAEGCPSLNDWMAAFPASDPNVSRLPSDIVTIPMTGGTTGVPKAVALSNRNFNALVHGLEMMTPPGERVINLVVAPMTHAAGRVMLTVMFRGGQSVIMSALDPQQLLQNVEDHRITDLFMPPTVVYTMLDQPNIKDFDLSSLKRVSYGSAPMSLEKLKEALRVFGPVMSGGFGQTECPMLITRLLPDEHFVGGNLAPDTRLKSVGKETPLSTVRIMGEDGNLLPSGEVGEIVVRGPMVSEGYYQNPEATAEIRRNGWHLTGDIGVLDEDGYLTIVDRRKDMIITGGFNVFSAEVEREISIIPGVRDCVVIGVPDEKWGEAVKGVVQTDAGTELSEGDIIAVVRAALGSVKAPKSIDFVADLPRTVNNKVDKKAVRNRYWESAGRSI